MTTYRSQGRDVPGRQPPPIAFGCIHQDRGRRTPARQDRRDQARALHWLCFNVTVINFVVEMLLFLGVLTVGFIYEWRKGALEWD